MEAPLAQDHAVIRSGSKPHPPVLARFWVHVVFLAVVLLAIFPIASNGFIAIVDEGVYSAQASILADGSWAAPRPVPQLDDKGIYGSLLDSAIIGNKWIPYARQPLYPVLLSGFYKLGGYNAMLVLSMFGTWAAAVSAGGIARLIDRRFGIVALWLTGLGTPLLFDAYIVVGHSLVAAAIGVSAYALLRACGERDTGGLTVGSTASAAAWTAAATASAATAVLLRSEGSLGAGALAVVGALMSIQRLEGRWRINWHRAVPSIVVGIGSILAFLANDRWAAAIVAGGGSGTGAEREPQPLSLAWVSLLRPWSQNNTKASASMTLVVVCIILAAIAFRALPRRPLAGTALLGLAAAAAVARQLEGPDLISGLLPTIPAVVLGLLLIGRSDVRKPVVRFALGAAGLCTAATLLLAYGMGGATEWGGRFFHLTLPLIVPAAVAALDWRFREMARPARIVSVAALAIATASMSVLAIRCLHHDRAMNKDVVGKVVNAASSAPPGTPVIVANLQSSGITRLYWEQAVSGFPILNGIVVGGLSHLVPRLEEAGHGEVLVVTDIGPDAMTTIARKESERSDKAFTWKVTNSKPLGDTGFVMSTLELTRHPAG